MTRGKSTHNFRMDYCLSDAILLQREIQNVLKLCGRVVQGPVVLLLQEVQGPLALPAALSQKVQPEKGPKVHCSHRCYFEITTESHRLR